MSNLEPAQKTSFESEIERAIEVYKRELKNAKEGLKDNPDLLKQESLLWSSMISFAETALFAYQNAKEKAKLSDFPEQVMEEAFEDFASKTRLYIYFSLGDWTVA